MKSLSKFFAGFLIGGIVGGLIASLFAPMTGEQMRLKIMEKYDDVSTDVKEAAKVRSEELKLELAKLQKKV